MAKTESPNSGFDYPNVVCDKHPGDPLPGWLVCEHAFRNPLLLVSIAEPTKEVMGIIICDTCVERAEELICRGVCC